MDMTNKEYIEYVETKNPKSAIVKNSVKAFLIGGTICSIGQAFLELYLYFGLDKETASTLVTVTMIFLGTLLTGLDVYYKARRCGYACARYGICKCRSIKCP